MTYNPAVTGPFGCSGRTISVGGRAMSRFDNLEFDDEARPGGEGEGRLRGGTGTPVRDAAYFQGVADLDFLDGDHEAALRGYSRALQEDPALLACWVGQVRALVELGELKEAEMWADKALERFPEDPGLLSAKALAVLRTGWPERAMAYSDNAMSREGAGPFAWLARGEILLARDSRSAEHCFGRAVAACGSAAERGRVRASVATTLRRFGRFTAALRFAQEAVQDIADSAAAWLELGRCQQALGFAECDRSFAQAVQLAPGSEAARRALRGVDRGGVWPWAVRRLRRLLRR